MSSSVGWVMSRSSDTAGGLRRLTSEEGAIPLNDDASEDDAAAVNVDGSVMTVPPMRRVFCEPYDSHVEYLYKG